MFQKIDSSPQDIVTNGICFLLALYGASNKIDCLDKYRYLTFVKNTRNSKRVQLSCLPPTSASSSQHLYRVYYQVQVWLGNQLDPSDWGWKLVDNTLEPIDTLLPPAPERLLNTISAIAERIVVQNVAVKKSGYYVHRCVLIAEASLAPMLNQIQ